MKSSPVGISADAVMKSGIIAGSSYQYLIMKFPYLEKCNRLV
jgi:hypothetical protein